MSTKPNTKWGVGKDKQPENRLEPTITIVPSINAPQQTFKDQLTFNISLFQPAQISNKKLVFPATTDKIYFTTDGTDPIKNSKLEYSSPVTINKNTTVKAVSYNEATGYSPVIEAKFYQFAQDKKIILHSVFVKKFDEKAAKVLFNVFIKKEKRQLNDFV